MKALSIRWKLTLWYGGVLAAVLLIFGLTVYLMMGYQLMERIDHGLAEELSDVRYEILRATDAHSLLEWLDRRFARHAGFDFQISKADGKRFFASERLVDTTFPQPRSELTLNAPTYETVSLPPLRWRVISDRITGTDGLLTVLVGRSLSAYDHEQAELLTTLLLTGPLTLLLAVSGGYYLARRALAPVQTMARTAEQITAERLNTRLIVVNGDDELGELAQTLNRMIVGLERSFEEMKRFTADAAHELRTPLAVIRSEVEVALHSTRSTEEYGRVLENVLEETVRLSRLADELLFLCRQDAGLNQHKKELVAFGPLLEDVVNNMRPVAQEKEVGLFSEIKPCSTVLADPNQLRRVLYNLIDNAIKYTPAPGKVTVASVVIDDFARVTISDTGIGIPEEHLHRVLDRFYRVDSSRTDNGGGAGLGLSIAHSIVKSMNGTITLTSSKGGTMVVVTLPVAQKDVTSLVLNTAKEHA